jgi:hypothetical protein
MYGGYLRRLEKSKAEWYRAKGQVPPNLGFSQPVRQPKKIDTHTYTTTNMLDQFSPASDEISRANLSYWEGEGAGVEPDEFHNTARAMRRNEVMSPYAVPRPKIGELNRCFTPYENDLMTFEVFETTRHELKERAEHIALEMDRVNQEWTRDPVKNWFALKGGQFTVEHCRFMEILRRENYRKACQSARASKRKTSQSRQSV